MKKIYVFTFIVFSTLAMYGSSVHAQSVKDKNFASLGLGIGSYGLSGTGGIPITVSFEHGFTDQISGGGFASIIKRKFYKDYTYTYYVIGAKASYHLNEALKVENPKFDLYGGLSLFYRGFNLKYANGEVGSLYKSNGGNIGIGIHAGGRYSFNNSIGGFAELGYGVSPLQIGVSIKF